MSRNGSGVYSLPPGSTVANGDTSDAADLNTPLADLEADNNAARPIVAGGTGATTASGARTALGLAIGTDVQAFDAFLDDIAALTDPGADRLMFWDDSAGEITWLTAGTGLAISGTSITSAPADDSVTTAKILDGNVTFAKLAGAAVVTSGETIASNDNDTTIPTSAAVKDYADAAAAAGGGMTLLATLTTTSGTTQTASGLTLTSYKRLYVTVAGVSFNASSSLTTNGANLSAASGGAANALDGMGWIDLTTGSAVFMLGVGSGNNLSPYQVASGLTTASTSISFAGGTFDAGTIRIYGER